MAKGRILGIGGIFLKSADADQLRAWYQTHLGIQNKPEGFMFPWQTVDEPHTEHATVWSIFPSSTAYFAPSNAPFMINYLVENLDALLEDLRSAGVSIDPKREEADYGRFAWIFDPDGNKIELWEPPPPAGA
jgi:catechol 2,3-dioxygenase-like lactoylglutathione lyase family enzyme